MEATVSRSQAHLFLLFHNNFSIRKGVSVIDTSYGPVKIGVYARHLERWLQYFPLSQLLFISGERLIVDPAYELGRVQVLHSNDFQKEILTFTNCIAFCRTSWALKELWPKSIFISIQRKDFRVYSNPRLDQVLIAWVKQKVEIIRTLIRLPSIVCGTFIDRLI